MPSRIRSMRVVASAVVYVVVVILMARAALADLGGAGARAGGYVVADTTPWMMLLGLCGLPVAVVLAARLSGHELTSPDPMNRRGAILLVAFALVTLGTAVVGKGLALRAAMAVTGRLRCEPLDELRRSGTSRRNDRMLHAYVDLRTASPDVTARCGYEQPSADHTARH